MINFKEPGLNCTRRPHYTLLSISSRQIHIDNITFFSLMAEVESNRTIEEDFFTISGETICQKIGFYIKNLLGLHIFQK